MRKKIVLLLTGCLMLTGIGCGSEKQDTPVATQGVTEQASPTEATEFLATDAPTPTPTDAPTPTPTEVPEEPTYLRETFAAHGMKTGTCLTTQMINNKFMANLIPEQFNSVTMENAMKPDSTLDKNASIAAGDLVVNFNNDVITMLDWARDNNMAVRGHTIIWHSQTPKWIFHEDFDLNKPFVGREVMLARMESYIKQVFEKLDELGYIDLIYAYDVVNEAWMEDGTIRNEMNYWYHIIGEDYLWYAFYYADKYAPKSIDLYYNDYNEQYKTDALIQFVDTLKDEEGNSLIDGIGLQAHLYTQDDLDQYLECVKSLGSTGLKIELTELDVSLGRYQKNLPATDTNLKEQGRYYYNLVNGLFELVDSGAVRMDALTFWGFADGLSWRKEASPLLYNTTYKPKYAYYGALQMKEKAGFDEE